MSDQPTNAPPSLADAIREKYGTPAPIEIKHDETTGLPDLAEAIREHARREEKR